MATISKDLIAAVALWLAAASDQRSRADDSLFATSDPTSLSAAPEPSNARTPAELRTAVTEALRALAIAKGPTERDRAGRQLISILLELEQDHKLPSSDRVKLHAQVRSRLLALEKTLRAEQANRGAKSSSASTDPKDGEAAIATDQAAAVLAQVAGPAAGARLVGIGGPAPVAVANRAIANAVVGQSQSLDYGPDLVDLIHAVIQPSTWDVNGGPGSVVYYRNFRVLVVTAPSDVHSEIGNLLGQLRK